MQRSDAGQTLRIPAQTALSWGVYVPFRPAWLRRYLNGVIWVMECDGSAGSRENTGLARLPWVVIMGNGKGNFLYVTVFKGFSVLLF